MFCRVKASTLQSMFCRVKASTLQSLVYSCTPGASRAGRALLSARGSDITSRIVQRKEYGTIKHFLKKFTNPWATQKTPNLNNNLCHKLSESPSPGFQNLGKVITRDGSCPTCETKGVAHPKKPVYECPDCGFPTHCSKEHYLADYENHKANGLCDSLRIINEDGHDIYCRQPTEFIMPEEQPYDEAINLSNWEALLYTRRFSMPESDRSFRHLAKALTYPMTVASILHPQSPYTLGNCLTVEGLRTMSALRYTLSRNEDSQKRNTSKGAKIDLSSLPSKSARGSSIHDACSAIRIFIIGSRAEAMLPPGYWHQMCYLFPGTPFHLYFIGPEAIPEGHKGKKVAVSPFLRFHYSNKQWHEVQAQYGPFDPYTDVFFLFHPGVGQPIMKAGWQETMAHLIPTKCGIFMSGFSKVDLLMDVKQVYDDWSDEIDWLLNPTENLFASRRCDVLPQNITKQCHVNWGVYGIRGKKYDVQQAKYDEL